MKNIESIKEFLNKSGEPECYILTTDKGCIYNATCAEALTLITCLVSELKNDIPKNMFKKAIDLGFEVDRKALIESNDKEMKEMDKELEDLEKKIKNITDLMKEL